MFLLKRFFLYVILVIFLLCSGCSKIDAEVPVEEAPDISAWVVDWDLDRGMEEIGSISDKINSVQLFAAYFNREGKPFLPENLKELLRDDGQGLKEYGIKNPYLTVVNDVVMDDENSIQKDSNLIENIMLDEANRKEHVQQLINLIKDTPFSGLVIDYEKIPYETWDEYALFIDELGSEMKREGKDIRIVLEPRSPIDTVKLPCQYEYTMMAYNLHDTRTSPGAKADRELIEQLCDRMNENLDNVRIAFSLGGFDWPEQGDAKAVTEIEAQELLLKYGAEKKYYEDSGAAYFYYSDENGVKHIVCYADDKTLIYWANTALEKGINNFDIWRLGGNSKDTVISFVDYAKASVPADANSGSSYPNGADKDKESHVVPNVVTGRKILSLTFNGLPDEERTAKILDELDAFNIKATFFISGIKAGEEREAARMIVERGHELGDSTLSGIDLTKENYDEKIRQISKSRDAIAKFTGVRPEYLRPGHGAVDDEVRMAAAGCGYDYIVTYSVNPQDWDKKSPEDIAKLVDHYKKKGGIIILNADKNSRVHEAIPLIYKALEAKGYEIVPLWRLIEIYKYREENKYIPDHSRIKVDTEYKNKEYRIIEEGKGGNMQVAITFDDWGTDDTIDGLLDVLDRYNVKATFFLRAKGVESNPSLAQAISDRGHEIANHTYSHTDLNLMTPLEIQQDVVKAHEVIASAINKEPSIYLRPPRGIVTEEAAQALAACGYGDIIMYSVTALDWDKNVTAQKISSHMVDNAFDGAIILLHMLDNINTTEALPAIIEGLRAKGYSFVTVGEMLSNE